MSDEDSKSKQDKQQDEAAKDAESEFNSEKEKSSDLNPDGPAQPDDALPKAEQDERL